MYDRVEQHFAVLRAAVDDGGGEVFATMGDGIAAAFTSVEGALQAAVAAQHEMPATGLAVRMGIHTGEVERVGDDFRGRAVNRAARIMAVGHGGQILLSDVAAALVRTGHRPGRARRPRHPPAARPDRAGAGVAGRAPRPRPAVPARPRRRHVLQQPAGPALLAGRAGPRRPARRRHDATPPDRDAHRRRRRRQDPPRRAGRGRPPDRVRHRVVRRAGLRRPTPTTSPTRSPARSARSASPDPLAAAAAALAGGPTPARPRQLRARRRQRGPPPSTC